MVIMIIIYISAHDHVMVAAAAKLTALLLLYGRFEILHRMWVYRRHVAVKYLKRRRTEYKKLQPLQRLYKCVAK